MSRGFALIISFVVVMTGAGALQAQERDSEHVVAKGSLSELRGRPRVWLIVRRGVVLDARGVEASVITEVYREANPRPAFPRTYNMIARRLNKYMKEHGSLSAARNLSDADFILFFNVLEIRRPLGTPYAYGELFVILNRKAGPRILWRTRNAGKFVDDAVGDFISELKAVRGEK